MIRAERAHLHVAAVTHPGMSGKNNEDRYAVSALRLEGERPLPVLFAIVSDGVGGHRAGEVAAQMAVDLISASVARSDGSQPLETLRQAITSASQAIFNRAQAESEKHGMGATCACALVIDDRLFVASVGDTRIYLKRGDALTQLTIDHTWIQEALEVGLVSAEEARSHPNAHMIRRYLGSPQTVEPDLRLRLSSQESTEQMMANQGLRLQPGDQIVLCSDGLTDLVEGAEILASLRQYPLQQALYQLTDLANQRGGHDNITIVALQVPAATRPLRSAGEQRRPLSLSLPLGLTCLGGGLLALALTLVLVGGFVVHTLLVPTATPTAPVTITLFPSDTPPATPTVAQIVPPEDLPPLDGPPTFLPTPLPLEPPSTPLLGNGQPSPSSSAP